MDVVDAYARLGSYRAAGELCGVDPKTVKRKVLAHEAGRLDDECAERAPAPKNTDVVRGVVLDLVREANGRGTAKRLLPAARAARYGGSDRNFRRLVASVKRLVRGEIGRHQRRSAVWVPGETLVIDSGLLPNGLKVFCAVLAWSRVRFVRVACDETAATTLAMLADCFDTLGGVPAKLLADRMGCLKGGTIANVVIPTPDYVRFATHYRFAPDFWHPADPESKEPHAFVGWRQPGDVAAQLFQPPAAVCFDAHHGVQAEAVGVGAQGWRAVASRGIARLRVSTFCPARGPKALRFVASAAGPPSGVSLGLTGGFGATNSRQSMSLMGRPPAYTNSG